MLVLMVLCGSLHAHQIAEMPLALDISGDRLTGTIEADAAYMVPEFRGDENEDPKDMVWLRELGPDGWKVVEAESDKYWHECLKIEADGKEVPWTMAAPDFHKAEPALLTEGEPEDLPMVQLKIQGDLPPGTRKLELTWHEPFGVVLIVTTGEGKEADAKPMVSGEKITVAEWEAKSETLRSTSPSLHGWIVLGYRHILPDGVDHILFVIGLFLLIPKWKPLLKQTITFTIAHSISLGAATLGWVSFPPLAVEVIIGASIAWVGIENLWAKKLEKGRLVLVGVFGLIHGLSFASILKALLPVGQPEKLPTALLGFNVGVELGQVVVILIAFLCFGWVKEGSFVWVKRIGSVLVALAGIILMIERLSGRNLVPFF